MEDAATAEIARAQLWQWLHHGGVEFTDHAPIDFALFDQALAAHTHKLRDSQHPGADKADAAAALLSALTHADAAGRLPDPARLRPARPGSRSVTRRPLAHLSATPSPGATP